MAGGLNNFDFNWTPPSTSLPPDRSAFSAGTLITIINQSTQIANQKLVNLQARGSAISIADMFDMQMLMNHLSQLSEMASAVVAAANSAITKMASNISR